MTENLPENFDPQQPDLPALAVDPTPPTEPEEAEDTRRAPLDEER